MRLKTPLFLLLFIGAICIIIFAIWPKFDEINLRKADLKRSQEMADTILRKNANIENLKKELDSEANSNNKRFIDNFIPYDRNEEKVVNTFNEFLKSDAGLTLIAFGVEDVKIEEKTPVEVAAPESSADAIFGSPAGPDGAPVAASRMPSIRSLREQATVSGKYENIKALVRRIYSLDLMKNISTLDINSVTGEDGTPTGFLDVRIVTDYNYIPMAKIGGNYESPIFSLERLDFQTVPTLEQKMIQKSVPVFGDSSARTNPFLP